MFRWPILVSERDTDAFGHVNNAVYVRWLQEAGTAHWMALATEAEQRTLIWFVARHEIDYLKPCFAGEDIVAETWCENPRGARFDRRVRIRGADGRIRAEALTTWVLIDGRSQRPMRIPAAIIARFDTPPG